MVELVVTHRSEVTPDRIDHLGHMNVAFYAQDAAVGARAFAADLGVGEIRLVDGYTRYHAEQLEGERLEVRTAALDVGPHELRLYQELRNADTDVAAATFVQRYHLADAPSSDPKATVADLPEVGRPRTIDLDADPVTSAPPVEVLVERELAIRHPRRLSADECEADGGYRQHMAPMLVWGGEAIHGESGPTLHDGPNGEKVGFATMEARITLPRLPRLGDRIQAFGADVGLGAKTTHSLNWVFDVGEHSEERGALIATFEIVGLAFDTIARRAMEIPPDLRARREPFHHPDLAPGS